MWFWIAHNFETKHAMHIIIRNDIIKLTLDLTSGDLERSNQDHIVVNGPEL
jgi:hypothetical protein